MGFQTRSVDIYRFSLPGSTTEAQNTAAAQPPTTSELLASSASPEADTHTPHGGELRSRGVGAYPALETGEP